MSITAEPEIEDRHEGRGVNLVAFAKPYFGLIVLTTVLLSAFGLYLECSECPAASIRKWHSRGSWSSSSRRASPSRTSRWP